MLLIMFANHAILRSWRENSASTKLEVAYLRPAGDGFLEIDHRGSSCVEKPEPLECKDPPLWAVGATSPACSERQKVQIVRTDTGTNRWQRFFGRWISSSRRNWNWNRSRSCFRRRGSDLGRNHRSEAAGKLRLDLPRGLLLTNNDK